MKTQIWILGLLAVVASGFSRADVCFIDAKCNDKEFPFRVFYADSGSNVLGECYRTFDYALGIFEKLYSIGQCDRGDKPQDCVLESCNVPDYPFRVLYRESKENVTDRCFSGLSDAYGQFQGLVRTGQCQKSTVGKRCVVERSCNVSGYPFRVVYRDDKQPVMGVCQSTFEASVQLLKSLQDFGQCTL